MPTYRYHPPLPPSARCYSASSLPPPHPAPLPSRNPRYSSARIRIQSDSSCHAVLLFYAISSRRLSLHPFSPFENFVVRFDSTRRFDSRLRYQPRRRRHSARNWSSGLVRQSAAQVCSRNLLIPASLPSFETRIYSLRCSRSFRSTPSRSLRPRPRSLFYSFVFVSFFRRSPLPLPLDPAFHFDFSEACLCRVSWYGDYRRLAFRLTRSGTPPPPPPSCCATVNRCRASRNPKRSSLRRKATTAKAKTCTDFYPRS